MCLYRLETAELLGHAVRYMFKKKKSSPIGARSIGSGCIKKEEDSIPHFSTVFSPFRGGDNMCSLHRLPHETQRLLYWITLATTRRQTATAWRKKVSLRAFSTKTAAARGSKTPDGVSAGESSPSAIYKTQDKVCPEFVLQEKQIKSFNYLT